MNPVVDNLLGNRKYVFGQILAIFFIQASFSTAFAVFYSGLSIYLTHNKQFSQESASILTSLFLSLNYFLPLIGSIIATKFISYKKLYFLGTIFGFSGCLLLVYNYLYLGLSFFLMASLSNVCLNIFLTQLFYNHQKLQRRIAFMWSYVGMNFGFLIGYFLTGYSTINNNYSHLFALIGFLVLLSLILTMLFVKEPKLARDVKKSTLSQTLSATIIIILLITIINILFHYASSLHNYIIFFTVITMSLMVRYVVIKSVHDKGSNLIKFMFFSLLTIIFWTFYMLTPIAIMQIIENAVERNFLGIQFAPQWFTNLNTFVIITFIPLITLLIKKKLFNDLAIYFALGFLFVFFSCLLISIGFYLSAGITKLSPLIMMSYLIFLACGEILISPISDSFVGEFVKDSLRGIMTGVARVNICIGVLFASLIANKFALPFINKKGLTQLGSLKLEQFFFIISLISLTLAFLVLLFLREKRVAEEKCTYVSVN